MSLLLQCTSYHQTQNYPKVTNLWNAQEILHGTLKDAIIYNYENNWVASQLSSTLRTYMDIMSCRKNFKQIWKSRMNF